MVADLLVLAISTITGLAGLGLLLVGDTTPATFMLLGGAIGCFWFAWKVHSEETD